MPNTIPVQVGGEWRSPAESVGYCRFQIALSGSLSANLVQTAGRSGSEASVGLTRSGLNTAQGRSRGGLVSEITIKQDLYAGCFVQVQSAVQTFRGEIEAEDTRTFRQRILSIFSVSLGVPVGRFSTFQLMSPSLEDLAQAFFLRVSLTVDANHN